MHSSGHGAHHGWGGVSCEGMPIPLGSSAFVCFWRNHKQQREKAGWIHASFGFTASWAHILLAEFMGCDPGQGI